MQKIIRFALMLLVACTIANINNAVADDVAKIYTSYFSRVVVDDPKRPGIAYEIVREIFKKAGLKCEIIQLPWARAQYMAKHTPQSLIFPYSRTPTREDDFVWKVNIFNNQTHFITYKKPKLTAEEAKDKLIGVQLKSSWDNWLTEQGYQYVYRVPDEGESMIKLIRNDRIDAIYIDKILGDNVVRKAKDSGFVYSDPIQIFYTFLATQKADPYPHMDKLKIAMDELRQSGKLDELFEKYDIDPLY